MDDDITQIMMIVCLRDGNLNLKEAQAAGQLRDSEVYPHEAKNVTPPGLSGSVR